MAAFPRDKPAPAFPQGKAVSQDFQTQISLEVADGYCALVGSPDPAVWNPAVSLACLRLTTANCR